jgi:hypothetical protein
MEPQRISIFDLISMLVENMDNIPMEEEVGKETAEQMATYYAPIFKRELRTESFLKIFQHCFTAETNLICREYPRPIICNSCCQLFIKNAQNAMKMILDDDVINTLNTVIIPRLHEVNDTTMLITENAPPNTNLDEVLLVLDIDMSHYDPPSKELMDKCEKYTYVKKDIDEGCTICQCDLENGDDVHKLLCGHIFHQSCVGQWLMNHSTCPNCNFSLK